MSLKAAKFPPRLTHLQRRGPAHRSSSINDLGYAKDMRNKLTVHNTAPTSKEKNNLNVARKNNVA